MKIGLVSISFRKLTPEEIVRMVARHGLQGIEWGGDVHVPHGNTETAQRVALLTRDAGLEVASYGSYYRFAECDPEADNTGPSFFEVLETAQALGAPAIRVWAGTQSPHKTSDQVRNAIVTQARKIAEIASAEGLRLHFEFHENTLTETPESTVRLLKEIGHPNVSSLWQPPLLTSPLSRLEGLRKIKPWISNIHCNHFGQEPWPHVQDLGDGKQEWSEYLKELNQLPDDRWILIEHVRGHSPEQFPRDARTLKNWLR